MLTRELFYLTFYCGFFGSEANTRKSFKIADIEANSNSALEILDTNINADEEK